MTRHPGHPVPPGPAAGFDTLMAGVLASSGGRFGHRQHVELTWLAVRRYGMPAAIRLVSDGIKRTARYAGAPQKYHETISRAWVELVAHHATGQPARRAGTEADFAIFAARNPLLLDKRLLTRFYHPATLASPAARTGWVEPDRGPFPWAASSPPRAPGPSAATLRPALPGPAAPPRSPSAAPCRATPGTGTPPPPAGP
jgi:hypothetical protein